MMLAAGKLRHRVRIERFESPGTDSNGDTLPSVWVTVADNVAAGIDPLSARELMQAQAMQSAVNTKLTLRYRTGLNAAMRIVHTNRGGTTIYNIAGVIPDNRSGLEWLTLPVTNGISEG